MILWLNDDGSGPGGIGFKATALKYLRAFNWDADRALASLRAQKPRSSGEYVELSSCIGRIEYLVDTYPGALQEVKHDHQKALQFMRENPHDPRAVKLRGLLNG